MIGLKRIVVKNKALDLLQITVHGLPLVADKLVQMFNKSKKDEYSTKAQ